MIIIRPNAEFYTSCNTTFGPCSQNSPKKILLPDEGSSSSTTTGKILLEKTPLHRKDTKTGTTLSLDIAGFTLEDIQVELENHILTVSAERTNRLGDTFSIRRRFTLEPDVYDEEAVSAALEEGVLELTVPRKPEPKPRQIKINVKRSAPVKSVGADNQETSGRTNDQTAETKEATLSKSEEEALAEESVSVETVEKEEADDDEKSASRDRSGSSVASAGAGDNWEEVAQV